MNLASPSTKGQAFMFNNMSPGGYAEAFSGMPFGNYSPETNKLKGI